MGTRLAALALVCALAGAAAVARAQVAPQTTQSAEQSMQLEVILNGNPTQLIGSFVMRPDRRLAARLQELEELGLKPRDPAKFDSLVVLDDLSGLSYVYEESTQQVCI